MQPAHQAGLHPLFVLILILHVQCFDQFDILVFFAEVLQGELVCEEDDRTLEVVKDQHGSGIEHVLDLFQRGSVVARAWIGIDLHPSGGREVQSIHAHLRVVFVLEAVFKHLKLQLTDRADDNLVVLVAVDLDRALLRELRDAFLELLGLHSVLRRDQSEKLRREGRQRFEKQRFFGRSQRIADLIVSGIIDPDDIARDRSFYVFSFVGHQHGGLRQFHFLAGPGQPHAHAAGKGAGADAEKRQSVAVRQASRK